MSALDSWTAKQRLKASSFEQRATPLVMTRPLPAELQPPAPAAPQGRCASYYKLVNLEQLLT